MVEFIRYPPLVNDVTRRKEDIEQETESFRTIDDANVTCANTILSISSWEVQVRSGYP